MSVKRYPTVTKYPHFLHGGDYNPDQWLHMPEIIEDDFRLMKQAHVNSVTLGVFAWSALEPEDGRFNFEWMDRIMDRCAAEGIQVILATPSASQPAWMSQKYPEVMRMGGSGHMEEHGARVRYCLSSPVYREKVRIINTKLAERYGKNPALVLWHISNEYGGHCHCKLCCQSFREWLQRKYGTLEKLNLAWWSNFWGNTYNSWDQINTVTHHNNVALMAMSLDYRRWLSDQTIDFMKAEIAAIRPITPDIPVTTNLMGWDGVNNWKMSEAIDVASWDAYPAFDGRLHQDVSEAYRHSMWGDAFRGMKNGRPWILMESSPSSMNWRTPMKLKRPGIHRQQSLWYVAHGADTVCYFQWRAGRGGMEKFHGAVVDHSNSAETRVFKDVAGIGVELSKMDRVLGTSVKPEVAIIFDWDNWVAVNVACGPRADKQYQSVLEDHYYHFWSRGIPVDVIPQDRELSGYKLVIAPMLYLLKPGVAERFEKFVEAGGNLVVTYWSGIVDENDRCFMGGRPGPLRKLLGVWAEELEGLHDDENVPVKCMPGNKLKLRGKMNARMYCDLIHAEGAQVLATYDAEFYKGRPALTCNSMGKGKAYYMAFRGNREHVCQFHQALENQLKLKRVLDVELPYGVTLMHREDESTGFIFAFNFGPEAKTLDLGTKKVIDHMTGRKVTGKVKLEPHAARLWRRN